MTHAFDNKFLLFSVDTHLTSSAELVLKAKAIRAEFRRRNRVIEIEYIY